MNKMFRFVEAVALITMMLIPLASLIQTATSADAKNIVITLQCTNVGRVKRTSAIATVTLTQTGRMATLICDTNLNFSAQQSFMPTFGGKTDTTFTATYTVTQDVTATVCNQAAAIAFGGGPLGCPNVRPFGGSLIVVLQ